MDSAKKWYAVAAQLGNKDAAKMLKILTRRNHRQSQGEDMDYEN